MATVMVEVDACSVCGVVLPFSVWHSWCLDCNAMSCHACRKAHKCKRAKAKQRTVAPVGD